MKSFFFSFVFSLIAICVNANHNPITATFGCPNASKVDVPAGTLVILETNEKLSAQNATIGKLVQMRVRTNVVAEGKVVIRTGSQAVGRVKSIEESTYSTPGSITIELFYVQAVDGSQLSLNGNEQTLPAANPNEPATAPINTMITAQLMNNEVVTVQ